MWLGGGEVDLKLGFYVADFIRGYKPSIWIVLMMMTQMSLKDQ